MKLLITGAFGLVGRSICALLERDYPEIEITKVKYDDTPQRVERDFDYIVAGAGYGQPQMFSKDKLACININTIEIQKLFRYLKSGGKFLFVSTSEVYSGAPSPHKETDIGNTTPQHPRACYIEGKRCGEAICMAYKEQGYDVKIARLALAYGPGTKKGDTRVLNQFIEQALTIGEIRMKDNGNALRTYVYVEDAARMMLNILFKGKDTVYNVGGESRTTIKDLASAISSLTKVNFYYNLAVNEDNLIKMGLSPGLIANEGAPDDVKSDMAKTLGELPMKLTSLDDGLKKTIEYQKTLYGK